MPAALSVEQIKHEIKLLVQLLFCYRRTNNPSVLNVDTANMKAVEQKLMQYSETLSGYPIVDSDNPWNKVPNMNPLLLLPFALARNSTYGKYFFFRRAQEAHNYDSKYGRKWFDEQLDKRYGIKILHVQEIYSNTFDRLAKLIALPSNPEYIKELKAIESPIHYWKWMDFIVLVVAIVLLAQNFILSICIIVAYRYPVDRWRELTMAKAINRFDLLTQKAGL